VWHAGRRETELEDLELEVPPADAPIADVLPMTDGSASRFANDVTEPVRAVWRAELAGIGGRSPLLHFDDGPTTRIELSTTHPGGLARFITGTTTLLSQLIRDDMALRGARLAADRIAAKGLELATTRGIDSIKLGIGLATWGFGDDSYCAPILLRPLALRRYGKDAELKLRGGPELNPALADALADRLRTAVPA
jgi:hypothetical protein